MREVFKEWEYGSSEHALFSCKELFNEEPGHPEYINEVDCGTTIVRCSGWRNVSNIVFPNSPSFLVFDINASFRDNIKSLSDIPRQITVYTETYILGGITSYVEFRKHYVGYITYTGGHLFYDGLPSTNPTLKKYQMPNLHGDASLLVYFPLENVSHVSNLRPEIHGFDSTQSNVHASGNPHDEISTNQMNESAEEFEQIPDDYEVSDLLLSKALFDLENENEENIYKKHCGKSYRQGTETHKITNSPPTLKRDSTSLSCPPCSLVLSPSSTSSCDESDSINMEIIDFINKEKDFILKLVSDATYSSDYHIRSERIMAMKNCSSLSTFQTYGRGECEIILKTMKPFIHIKNKACNENKIKKIKSIKSIKTHCLSIKNIKKMEK